MTTPQENAIVEHIQQYAKDALRPTLVEIRRGTDLTYPKRSVEIPLDNLAKSDLIARSRQSFISAAEKAKSPSSLDMIYNRFAELTEDRQNKLCKMATIGVVYHANRTEKRRQYLGGTGKKLTWGARIHAIT